MAFTSIVLRQGLFKNAQLLNALYSTSAKSNVPQGAVAGKEFFGMFSMRRIKKNWELAPLFIIMGGAVVGLAGFIAYASQTRDDVRYFSKANFETTDLLNPKKRKLAVFGQDYRPMNEVAEGYRAIEGDGEKKE